jgi:hypothetical protein
MNCACGKPATTVLDYTSPRCRVFNIDIPEQTTRIVVCDDCGDKVAMLLMAWMWNVDVVLSGDDIRALDSQPCWCSSARQGLILASGCPQHGMVR